MDNFYPAFFLEIWAGDNYKKTEESISNLSQQGKKLYVVTVFKFTLETCSER